MVTPEKIRSTAIDMANEIGLIQLKRVDLCEKLGIKDGSFTVIAGFSFTELIESIRTECTCLQPDKLSKKTRTSKNIRKDHILEEALKLSESEGFAKLSRDKVAELCGIKGSLIHYHFVSMENFKRDIMLLAIKLENLSVIAEGLAIRDVYAKKAPQELKERALAAIRM